MLMMLLCQLDRDLVRGEAVAERPGGQLLPGGGRRVSVLGPRRGGRGQVAAAVVVVVVGVRQVLVEAALKVEVVLVEDLVREVKGLQHLGVMVVDL